MQTINIDQVIVDGNQINRPSKACLNEERKGVLDLFLYEIQGHHCPRCKGNIGYHCRDAIINTDVWFCSKRECLLHDSACSKERKRKERGELVNSQQTRKPFEFLPARFQLANLSKWDATRSYHDKALRWLGNPTDFLLYTGGPSTGKTFFTCACFNWLISKYPHASIAWIDSKSFKNKVYDSIEKSGYFPILEKYLKDYKIIIFDDLEEFSHSSWQREVISIFIDMAFERQIPCLFTSGLSVNEISNKISGKVALKLTSEKSILIDMDDSNKRSKAGEL